MSKAETLASFLILLCLLGGVRCVQWQAAANISAANHTLIWSTIQSGLTTYVPDSFSGTDHTDLAKYISDTLNNVWDPAWNVFVFELVGDPTVDSIVVGYAFRDHWMWFNGYSYQGRTFSFIIWKDYNCVAWISVGDSAIGGSPVMGIIDTIVWTALTGMSMPSPYNDIWGVG
jgi:hypothetical protein